MRVNGHAAYTYLGGPWLNLRDIPFPERIITVRGDLNQGYKVLGNGGEAEVFLLGDAQGLVLQPGREQAEGLLAESSQILTALRSGGPLPDHIQAGRDLKAIMAAIVTYTKAHDGELPPDLGSVMNDIPADALTKPTAQERARVFLSPKAKRSVAVPANPSPEWVNAHTTYVYLGGAGPHMANLRNGTAQVLVRAAEPMEVPWGGGPPETMVLYVGTMERVMFNNPEMVDRWTEESQKELDAMRGGNRRDGRRPARMAPSYREPTRLAGSRAGRVCTSAQRPRLFTPPG